MKTSILGEILEWSKDRPAWQRDALRRLFTSEKLSEADSVELTGICKSIYGLSPQHEAKPLAVERIAIAEVETKPVSLMSVTHHAGVNALAPKQTVSICKRPRAWRTVGQQPGPI